ncbi:hypothetical protein BJN34_10990 [Cupriavidus necator]|uniref:Cytochrome C n=1 Tax=Cupriavidus necator TaxID=106590 RepID=A0A1U9UP19_CUPNE|nr:hypothetical protein BJN34_10990 [Cupriavidus necator]
MKRGVLPALRGGVSGVLLALGSMVAVAPAVAQVRLTPADEALAYRNYTLNCMGCHGPAGEAVAGKIPPLGQALGWFMHSPAGRQFAISVPGASNSALSDEELAQVTNLLLLRFNQAELPPDFQPYTADEVREHRRPALKDVATVRAGVIAELRKKGIPIQYGY